VIVVVVTIFHYFYESVVVHSHTGCVRLFVWKWEILGKEIKVVLLESLEIIPFVFEEFHSFDCFYFDVLSINLEINKVGIVFEWIDRMGSEFEYREIHMWEKNISDSYVPYNKYQETVPYIPNKFFRNKRDWNMSNNSSFHP
jgi:hypothetical protein